MMIPTINTARLKLRPLTKNDINDLVDVMMSDPDATKYLEEPENVSTLAGQQKLAMDFIEELSKPWNNNEYGGWAVCIRDSKLGVNGQFIGYCGFFPEQIDGEGPELGFGIGRPWWNKGLITEAAMACLNWIFSQGKISSVYAVTDKEHIAVQRVLGKLGMVHIRDVDMYDSVERGYGLMPFYSINRDGFVLLHKTMV